MSKKFMKGNIAIAEAAVAAGCRCFFGYPITPQNEIPEYLSTRLPEVFGHFIQAESETAAINMVYGAAGAGARAMTSSSSPGISLKQEGISYIACAEIPCVIVNVVRAGPGLGGILPAQSDYFQAVKGGGHGDYKLLVYAPSTVQEAVDLTFKAFEKADQYRTPVMILADGVLGQIMEPATIPKAIDVSTLPQKKWATTGEGFGKERRIINSLHIDADEMEAHTHKLFKKYEEMACNETEFESYLCDDAEIVLTAYGTVGRICKSACDILRARGIKAGLIRPITLFPFPTQAYQSLAKRSAVKKFLAIELSMGQMVEDVRLSVNGEKPVEFFGRAGGNMIMAEDIVNRVLGETK